MGWRVLKLEQYSLYTFGRLSSVLCLSEFRRRVKRALEDHIKSRSIYGAHSSIKHRIYADFLFLGACLTGIGWIFSLALSMLLYTLTHDWHSCGGMKYVLPTWSAKLFGATKPLGERG